LPRLSILRLKIADAGTSSIRSQSRVRFRITESLFAS
jgi:hypothetical protein